MSRAGTVAEFGMLIESAYTAEPMSIYFANNQFMRRN